ncbi:NAD(P)-dependent oxidoreductase [Variovorax sp. J22R133]|uniref:NAD(P)-dependent oxidoreductase n=1 Tax=Variovorax brevis TaxID=3053503 RepID=UPI00257526AC|nr:NAD(P)-dependent oxidoreductase [Variovorax sp. J22R133]MDM0115227.1 NAD(P)-dependent oxidoreductase [Variovorax sp. J22R133]
MAAILLTQSIHPQVQARLAQLGELRIAPDTSPDSLRRSAAGCDVIIVRAQLPEDIFDAAPSLVGAVRHGAGVDMIPIDAASAHGVLVANVPGVNANAVAEHVVRSMMQLARKSSFIANRLRERTAGWASARAFSDEGVELAGRTVGIVGFGNVGRAIARICAAGLGMKVLTHTRTPIDAGATAAERVALPALLAASDFVVLACPLTAETRSLIGAAQLATMRPGSWLINVARGPVVQDAALIDALQAGHLAGAALDVFDAVPLRADHPYWTMEQVLLTPHIAGITNDSMLAMGHGAALAAEHLLAGRVPPHCINPEAVPAFHRRRAA